MGRVIEDEYYYNNRYNIVDDILDFERVYMVDTWKFDSETFKALEKVYESLPCYLGNKTCFPCWYGNEENGDKYFLTVSFEMSGLQFWGKLPIADFFQWEKKFNKLIEDFPFKYHE